MPKSLRRDKKRRGQHRSARLRGIASGPQERERVMMASHPPVPAGGGEKLPRHTGEEPVAKPLHGDSAGGTDSVVEKE